MIRNIATLLSLFALIIVATVSCTNSAQMLDEQTAPVVQSRSSNFFTHDLEATTRFYAEYLGLEEAFRAEITAPKSRASYGVFDDAKITVVGYYPPSISDEKKGYAGISFFSVEGQTEPLFDRNVRSVGRASIVLAHRINNIDEIERRMKEAGAPIVSSLGPSATGRSRSMTVADPNGIMIETYEFVEKK